MLGFKRFFNARRILAGVELVHKIIKGQFGLPESIPRRPKRSVPEKERKASSTLKTWV